MRASYVFGYTVPAVHPSCPLHSHPVLELVWHPRGHGETTLADGRAIAFGPGDLVWYPPHQRHAQRFRRLGPDHCVHLAVAAPPPLFASAGRLRVAEPRLRRELEALAGPQGDSPWAKLALDHRSSALLAELADAAAPAPTPPADAAERAMALIRERPAAIAGMAELAAAVGLGPDRLRHVFTARWGMPPVQALTAARLAQARLLVERSPLGLDAIAHATGFATARYLCTLFKRHYHRSPGSLRRAAGLIDPPAS